ncbi:hypothetical protein [Winogradskyella helgolandensis]|uniref:hypothetical protein n=1 Tax=Winogradskyella helgolandensis TaxID=2697010 RepID=UPI0015C1BF12|nr:hypothetical protein [Winogradskyella helgolandensis]
MKKNIIICWLLFLLISCKSKDNITSNLRTNLPSFFGNELDFLGSYSSSREIDNDIYTYQYNKLNLKTVKKENRYEFWIDDVLIYSIVLNNSDECRIIEVFKKNFILISSGSCGIATPDFIDRNDVKVLDLNSRKVYSFSLSNLRLTRSIEMSKLAYPKSKLYYGILNFDLDFKTIKIYNQFSGVLEIDLYEMTNNNELN